MTGPRLRNPIVMVHGLMGFDAIRVGGFRLRGYFPGVEEAPARRQSCPLREP